jgi:hypothetical protein
LPNKRQGFGYFRLKHAALPKNFFKAGKKKYFLPVFFLLNELSYLVLQKHLFNAAFFHLPFDKLKVERLCDFTCFAKIYN